MSWQRATVDSCIKLLTLLLQKIWIRSTALCSGSMQWLYFGVGLTLDDLNTALDKIKNYKPPKNRYLIFNRNIWDWERDNFKYFKWLPEELDKAEKHNMGYIGMRAGVECYLPIKTVVQGKI